VTPISPLDLFPGKLLVVAPHMDDELLACGGVMALLPQKQDIHVVYATDGMKSPAPIMAQDAITPDLGERRVRESVAAMALLGVPEANLHFLRLPEAELTQHILPLRRQLLDCIMAIRPDHILLPFRYDRHPDHLAINRTLTTAREEGAFTAQLVEYFVYYRWRLLPGGDVRQYIRPPYLLEVETSSVAALKRQALDCFTSQTTIFYPWQTRPILTPQLLDDTAATPEYFLRYEEEMGGTAVFTHLVPWIKIAHRLEPFLQKRKYLLGASLKRRLRKRP
jgi:LmbE family N-acetylglucosaminyl deacetylase